MLLYEPEQTGLDLRWRMFGVDIRVHPFFWVFSAVLGWDYFEQGLPYLLMWILCVFVSILLHEFGHVLMGRAFGSESRIVLYSFGGLAVGATRALHRWQRIAVLLAGPGAQLLLWALVKYGGWALIVKIAPHMEEGRLLLLVTGWLMLKWINLAWALLNLLPIWPLDGGQITREVCEGVQGHRGTATALTISIVVSGTLAIGLLMEKNHMLTLPSWFPVGGYYTIILFALLCVGSIQALQVERERHRGGDDWPWQRWG